MVERVDAVVVGAGVIGLACARALALAGLETLVLERHAAFGTETSARNSEVIHAGIYYPTGSLKARLCVAGRERLYAFCHSHGVEHHQCGKLIVATSTEQEAELETIRFFAKANGVEDLRLLSRENTVALEPQLTCTAALLSSSTGIVDSHSLMLALLGDAERNGAVLGVNCPVESGNLCDNGDILLQIGDASRTQVKARRVINAAGHHAHVLARGLKGFPVPCVPLIHFARGNYFSLSGHAPFSRLIYPVPEPGGLGVHLTLDLAGQARFGPDVEWIDAIDYEVDPRRGNRFYADIRKYWPALKEGALQPAYAGIRPKLSGPGETAADFLVQGPNDHGIPGLVNLFGIESPGLTSCLALASYVCSTIEVEENFAATH